MIKAFALEDKMILIGSEKQLYLENKQKDKETEAEAENGKDAYTEKTNAQSDSQKVGQVNRRTNRQTDIHTDEQIDRLSNRQTD